MQSDSESRATQSVAPAQPAREMRPHDAYRVAPLLALVGLGLFAIAVRIPFLAVPIISDEGGYAYVAHFWAAGSRLYADLPFDRPQGIFIVYRAIFSLFGTDVIAMRVAAALASAATTIAVWLTARTILSTRAAWIAASLFALLGTCPSIEGFTANAELFTNLPLVVGAYFTWKQRWTLAGWLAGIACVIKPSGVSALLLVLGWCVLQRAGWRAALRATAAFAFGPIASVLHGMSVGFDAYFSALVSDRLLAFSLITSSAGAQWRMFIESAWVTSAAWALPAVLAASAASSIGPKALRFAALWLGASIAGMSIGGTWHGHYFMQVIPPLAVFAGGARLGAGWRSRSAWAVLLVLALGRFALQDAPLWFAAPDRISYTLYERPGYLFGQQIAEWIDARTKATDSMYVAFAEAQLYYLAKRRAAVPDQMYWNQAEHNKRAFDHAMQAIAERRPAIVVWSQPPPGWITTADFRSLLERGYQLRQVFGPIGVFERKT